MAEYRVSVIVVSYNTREKLRQCLTCIEPEHEVIVVDNASTDGSPEMVRKDFPTANLITNSENRGFGPANNQGLDVMSGKLALFLNSDCYADPGAIGRLAAVFESDAVVAAGGRLRNPDGSHQLSLAKKLTLWHVFLEQSFLDLLLRPFGLGYWVTTDFPRRTSVPQVMGACLMIRPVVRFDERFFMYCEDTDLCTRLRHHGKIVYEPTAEFIHELGSSSVGVGRWKSVARYNRGKELYFQIHRGIAAAWFCLVLNRLGALLRLMIWSVATLVTLGLVARFRQRSALFARVLTAPKLGPDHGLHTRR